MQKSSKYCWAFRANKVWILMKKGTEGENTNILIRSKFFDMNDK